MTIEEIYNNGNLSVRSFNVCFYNEIKTINDLKNYLLVHQTFKGLRNCGEKSNSELIQLSEKHQELTLINNLSKNENSLKHKIQNLNQLQKQVVNSFIKINTANLQVRSKNAIIALVGKTLRLKDFSSKVFEQDNFQIGLIKNVGKTSIPELENYLNKIKFFIQEVSENNDEKYLISLKNKFLIQGTFSIENIPNSILQSQSIIKICGFLIQENAFFTEKNNIVFTKGLAIFENSNYSSLEDLGSEINCTKERVRQIRLRCFDELAGKVSFLRKFEDDLYQNYEIDVNEDYLIISDEKAYELNVIYDTNFTKNFLTYLFHNYLSDDFAVVGNLKDVLINKQFIFRDRHNWANIYLVKKEFDELIYLEKLIEDLSFRKQEKIEETYQFSFKSYLSRFLKIDDFLLLDKITPFCERLIIEELNIYIDLDDNITFQRNTSRQVHEYAFEALVNIGKPSKVKDIYEKVLKLYPNYDTDENSIRASMKRNNGFLPIGRTSTFGLKIWEKEINNFKGGTIRSIIQDYLEKSNTPKHISEIAEHVLKYRPNSTEYSIYSNLKLDESGIFKFFNKSYIGLSSKEYDPSFLKSSKREVQIRTWEESYEVLLDFIKINKRLPFSSGCTGDEEVLHRWYNIQKKKINKGKMDFEKIQSIKRVIALFPDPIDKRKFNLIEKYIELNNFIKSRRRLPFANKKGEERLYRFFYQQRKLFEDNNLDNNIKKSFIELAKELEHIKK